MLLRKLIIITTLLTLSACKMDGVAHKGPFQPGSTTTLSKLDNQALSITSQRISSTVTGAKGNYSISNIKWNGWAEIQITGQYFNEYTGVGSSDNLTLNTITKKDKRFDRANIQLFSHFAAARIRHLVTNGQNITQAWKNTQIEVKQLFDLKSVSKNLHSGVEQLSFTRAFKKYRIDNANLLLFSGSFLATNGNSETLQNLSSDFADDGQFNGVGATAFNAIAVKASTQNLLKKLSDNLKNHGVTNPPSTSDMPTLPSWVIEGSNSDTIPPTITIIGDNPVETVINTEYSDAGATATDDVDGNINVQAADNINIASLGTYTVTYTAIDAAGNEATSTRIVNVIEAPDTIAPVIELLGANPDTILIDTSEVPATYQDPGFNATDNLDEEIDVNITGTVNTHQLGIYTLTYTATDQAGNEATPVERVINVVLPPDTVAPEITLNGSNPITLIQGSTFTDPDANAIDDRDGTVTVSSSGIVNTSIVGTYTITYSAKDAAGNTSTVTRTVIIILPPDTTKPIITLLGDNPVSVVQGETYIDAGASAEDDRDGAIDVNVSSNTVDINIPGTYTVMYAATDQAGNIGTATRTVFITQTPDNTAPVITINGGNITVDVGSIYNDAGATAVDDRDGSVEVITTGTVDTNTGGTYTLTYTALDSAGNKAVATRTITVKQARDTSNFNFNNFGYPYTDLIPDDATKGVYDETRFSMLTGKIQDESGTPISNVKVSIHQHGEYGTTTTDANGSYVIPAEGGVSLTVRYFKSGFTTIDRILSVQANDWAIAPDVTMLAIDSKVTSIELTNLVPQVHSSTITTDERGSRATTLVFDGVTKATVTSPDGSTRELTSFNVSATEFKVPSSMPSDLPRETAFTYASDLIVEGVSDDDTVVFDAPIVMYVDNFLGFDVGNIVPVGYYDRKIGKWVGSDNGVVIKLLDENGDGIIDGLDSTGDGVANDLNNDGSTNDEVSGIATNSQYQANNTYWRASFTHFTPWDLNWPWKLDDDATPPSDFTFDFNDDPPQNCRANVNSYVSTKTQVFHEDIGIAGTGLALHYSSQRVRGYKYIYDVAMDTRNPVTTLVKAEIKLEVAGQTIITPVPLGQINTYQLGWDGLDATGKPVQGEVSAKLTATYFYKGIFYKPDALPGETSAWANLPGVPIGGVVLVYTRQLSRLSTTREIKIKAEAEPSNKDNALANGWTLTAHDRATNKIIHKGNGTSKKITEFNLESGTVNTIAGNGTRDYSGNGGLATQAGLGDVINITADDFGNVYIATEYNTDPNDIDSESHIVIRKVDTNGYISVVAGGATLPEAPELDPPSTTDPAVFQAFQDLGDLDGLDGEALDAYFVAYWALVKEHFPGFYADYQNYLIILDKNNNPNGVDATQIKINSILTSLNGITVDNTGNLYFTDIFTVKKVDPNGIMTTVAGHFPITTSDYKRYRPEVIASEGFGDGGDAQLAAFYTAGLQVDDAGNIYINDYLNFRIRKVAPNGIITTVAGNGSDIYSGDGDQATLAGGIGGIFTSLRIDSANNIYIKNVDNSTESITRIRKINAGGIINTIFDSNDQFFTDLDNILGLPQGLFFFGSSFDIDDNQNIYFSQRNAVYKRSTNGLISQIAGTGEDDFSGDGGIATLATFDNIRHIKLNKNGVLYIHDEDNHRIRRVNPTTLIQEDLNQGGFVVKKSGNTADLFDKHGKQLKTFDLETGKSLLEFGYDNENRLTQITNQFSETLTISRDSTGAPTLITAPNGQQTVLTLTPNGDLQQVLYEDGTSFDFSYYAGSLMNKMIDPKGNQTGHTFNKNGRITQETDPEGNVWQFEKALHYGFIEYITTKPEGEKTTSKDSRLEDTGYILSETTLSVGDVIESITSQSQDYSQTKVDGVETENHYYFDSETQNRILDKTSTKMPSGLSTSADVNINYLKTGDTGKTRSRHVSIKQNTKTLSLVTDYENGTSLITSPEGRTAQSTYDKNTRLVSQTQSGTLTPSQYSYDAKGRLTRISIGDRVQEYRYDNRGNIEQVTTPKGEITHYTYDIVDQLTTVTYPDGKTVNYAYDEHGNITKLVTPTPSEHQFSYNKNDQRIGMTSPEEQATTYRYNKSRQLLGITTASGKQINNAYINGRLDTTTTPEGIFKYTYRFGNKASRVTYGSEALAYQYDGDLLTRIDQIGVLSTYIAYTYNNDFLVTQSQYADKASDYAYDKDSLLINSGDYALTRDAQNAYITKLSDGNYTQDRQYNNLGETTQISDNSLSISVQRNQNGEITQKQETLQVTPTAISTSYDYAYNDIGSLIEVKTNGAVSESYSYDANGNRLTATLNGETNTATYNLDDQLISYGNNIYEYDNDGYLNKKTTPAGINQYTYGTLGELKTITINDGITPETVISYLHDANNQRVAKQVNGQITEKYLWEDLTTLLAVYDSDNNLIQRFDYVGQRMPVSMEMGGEQYYLHYNQVGSLRALSDSNHNIVKTIKYDSFGNITDETNPSLKVPFGFAGGLYDADTKLTRFGYRDYDAYTGRWTAKDPIDFEGGDTSLYGYVSGNPVNFIDPLGLYTSVITIRDGGIGTHSAIHVTSDSEGQQFLYDPAGSYSPPSNLPRGSGDFFSGADASINSFIKYHTDLGSTVNVTTLNTSKKLETSIIENAIGIGGTFPGLCASSASGALGGACGIGHSYLPGSLGNDASNAQCK